MNSSNSNIIKFLESKIQHNLELYGHNPKCSFNEVYDYSLFPAGKLFRPLLFLNLYFDLKNPSGSKIDFLTSLQNPSPETHKLLLYCSFLEMHHVYTLIHDDLPSMDNDELRRGRASSHIKFNEWKALLAGDGLSIMSFYQLSQIRISNFQELIKVAAWSLGSKGLIRGQYLDLSQEMCLSFDLIEKTHILKTSRLIQMALIGALFIKEEKNFTQFKETWRLGSALGLAFQLLDDLDDFFDLNLNISSHEKEIQPWINYPEQSIKSLLTQLEIIEKFFSKNKSYINLKMFVGNFLEKNIKIISKNEHKLSNPKSEIKKLVQTLSSLHLPS